MENKSSVELLKLDRDRSVTDKRPTKLALTIAIAVSVGSAALIGVTKDAQAQSVGSGTSTGTGSGSAGECPDGMCGATVQDGGGSGCGSGCSTLVHP